MIDNSTRTNYCSSCTRDNIPISIYLDSINVLRLKPIQFVIIAKNYRRSI